MPMLISVSPLSLTKSLVKSAVTSARRGLATCYDNIALSDIVKLLKAFVVILVACAAFGPSAHAQPAQKPTIKTAKVHTVSANELASIRVTKYELALVQVMAEICPQMLSERQKSQFYEAYGNQLKAFIPSADNPEEILSYLSTQQDYRAVLHNVRSWTKKFPQKENRELCVDFANVSRAF